MLLANIPNGGENKTWEIILINHGIMIGYQKIQILHEKLLKKIMINYVIIIFYLKIQILLGK
jgi:hypothetical protein